MEVVIDQAELRGVLGRNVAALRKRLGLTQVALAAKLGISEQHLNRIETGKCSPGAEVLYGLSDVLGVPADKFRQVPLDVG